MLDGLDLMCTLIGMENKRTVIKSAETLDGQTVSFDVWDNKGRDVGCTVHLELLTLESVTLTSGTFINEDCPESGELYRWTSRATRGGDSFGGSNSHYCKSEDEMDSEVEEYIENARKRATKSFTA